MGYKLEDFANSEYIQTLPDYKQIRDCFNGSRAIKAAGTEYLPALKGQLDEDYLNYKRRALFFPVTGKTTSTLVGMATSQPPKIEYPADLGRFFDETDQGQYQFAEILQQIMTEVVLMGRFGALIDAPSIGQPHPVFYIAENIMRWIVDEHGSPIDVMLREYVQVPDGIKEFATKTETRYRRCHLVNGVYTVTVYDDDMNMVSAVTPLFTGETINFVPFTPFGSSGVHMHIDKPPMLDISTINISHYLSSADLEWGRHIVGLPTPVVSGSDSSNTLKIGGTSAWILPDPQSKAYYMEFQGQGLGSLERAMSDKISLMATMSARLVDTSSKGSEAAETVRLRYASDSATLIHIVGAVEAGLNHMYNNIAKLSKASGRVRISLSRDVLGANISVKDLKILFDGFLQGTMSKESLLYNMRKLDVADPNRSDEDELGAINRPSPKPQNTGQQGA
jgi:hypothetical protein